MEPNFEYVPHQVHKILRDDLNNSSEELFKLLTLLIENNDTLTKKAQNPINSVEELIDYLENHTIFELEEILS